MYTITIHTHFAAAHLIKGYEGGCVGLHGHNYRVEASVQTDTLSEVGIGVDFKELKLILQSVVKELDHRNLNELPPFVEENPTTENLARYIYTALKRKLGRSVRLASVRVWESETSSVTYTEEEGA